jgi:hypothetical protein
MAMLAACFAERPAANWLLMRAGFPPMLWPSSPGTANHFWAMVGQLVESGAVVDGRVRLLRLAADSFPANEVFARGLRGGGQPAQPEAAPVPADGTDGPTGTDRLTDDEQRTLAKLFPTPLRAAELLERAGMAARDLPLFAGSALNFWAEVSALLHDGRLPGGRRRVLGRAAELYPATVLAAGVPGGGPGAADRLTAKEVNELALLFPTAGGARALLASAGFDPDALPVFVGSPIGFWSEVNRSLGAGLPPDGRRRVLRCAAERNPDNDVFSAALAAPVPAAARVAPARRQRPAATKLAIEAWFITQSGLAHVAELAGQLTALVQRAVQRSGIPANAVRLSIDAGLLVGEVRGEIPCSVVVSDLMREMGVLVGGRNAGAARHDRLQLQVSCHTEFDAWAARDARPSGVDRAARQRFPQRHNADLVLFVSSEIYETTVRERLRDLTPGDFQEITQDGSASRQTWMALWGRP